jgi:hypothetical protein
VFSALRSARALTIKFTTTVKAGVTAQEAIRTLTPVGYPQQQSSQSLANEFSLTH